jgi:hypothetical protein
MYERELAGTLSNLAVRRGGRGFTFDDLIHAARARSVSIGRVAEWLAQGRSSGLLEDVGFDLAGGDGETLGPRRYRVARSRSKSEQMLRAG